MRSNRGPFTEWILLRALNFTHMPAHTEIHTSGRAQETICISVKLIYSGNVRKKWLAVVLWQCVFSLWKLCECVCLPLIAHTNDVSFTYLPSAGLTSVLLSLVVVSSSSTNKSPSKWYWRLVPVSPFVMKSIPSPTPPSSYEILPRNLTNTICLICQCMRPKKPCPSPSFLRVWFTDILVMLRLCHTASMNLSL